MSICKILVGTADGPVTLSYEVESDVPEDACDLGKVARALTRIVEPGTLCVP